MNKERTGPVNGLFFAVNRLVNNATRRYLVLRGKWGLAGGGWLRESAPIGVPRAIPLILATQP